MKEEIDLSSPRVASLVVRGIPSRRCPEGVVFNVAVVYRGERYGRLGCIVHDRPDPLIEFYDSRHASVGDSLGLGFLVSTYYASTLAEVLLSRGLCLDGSRRDEYSIDGASMFPVRELARSIAVRIDSTLPQPTEEQRRAMRGPFADAIDKIKRGTKVGWDIGRKLYESRSKRS